MIVAIIAEIFGFGGIAAGAASITKIYSTFFLFCSYLSMARKVFEKDTNEEWNRINLVSKTVYEARFFLSHTL